MKHLHPLFAAALGCDVVVTFNPGTGPVVDGRGQTVPSNIVDRAAGTLGLAVDADDIPCALVVESDGAAVTIPIYRVLSLEVIS